MGLKLVELIRARQLWLLMVATRRIAVRVWLQVVVMTTACARWLSKTKVP